MEKKDFQVDMDNSIKRTNLSMLASLTREELTAMESISSLMDHTIKANSFKTWPTQKMHYIPQTSSPIEAASRTTSSMAMDKNQAPIINSKESTPTAINPMESSNGSSSIKSMFIRELLTKKDNSKAMANWPNQVVSTKANFKMAISTATEFTSSSTESDMMVTTSSTNDRGKAK